MIGRFLCFFGIHAIGRELDAAELDECGCVQCDRCGWRWWGP